MSDPAVVAVIAAVSAVVASVVTGILARRSAHEANRVDAFEASLAGLESVLKAQGHRIAALELELGTMKTALVQEQQQHASTRELLRIAMKHIRDMLSWLGGDRRTDPPPVPDELTHQL